MRNVSGKRCGGNETHILCSVTFFFFEIRALLSYFGKYCRAGQGTDEIMARAHCILDI
jgi:hypothetical protein